MSKPMKIDWEKLKEEVDNTPDGVPVVLGSFQVSEERLRYLGFVETVEPHGNA